MKRTSEKLLGAEGLIAEVIVRRIPLDAAVFQ